MKNYLAFIICGALLFAGCKKDNKEAPSSVLSGKIVYNKLPLGLRSGGVELELWQYGYQVRSKIPVYVSQDGSYSAKIFNGNYKLTMLRGNGPWAEKLDSIDINLKGSMTMDVTVDPYFVIGNVTYTKTDTTVTASVTIQRVNTTRNLEAVNLYIGQTIVTDHVNNGGNTAELAASAIPNITQPITITAKIPAALLTKDYVYARVGIKTSGVNERLYSTLR